MWGHLSERGTFAAAAQEQKKIKFLQTARNLNKPIRAFQDFCMVKVLVLNKNLESANKGKEQLASKSGNMGSR